MKQYLKKAGFMFLILFAAFFVTWVMGAIATKYLDWFICRQIEQCLPEMIGCIPCSLELKSGVFTLKQPYLILLIVLAIIFFLLFFCFHQLTKKRFKF